MGGLIRLVKFTKQTKRKEKRLSRDDYVKINKKTKSLVQSILLGLSTADTIISTRDDYVKIIYHN